MKFLIDASADVRLVAHLAQLGHDATFVGLDYPGSMTDREIATVATAEHRFVVTDDRDFGDLVVRERRAIPGLIYFRIPGQAWDLRLARLDEALSRHPNPAGLLLVVTARSIRARSLDPTIAEGATS